MAFADLVAEMDRAVLADLGGEVITYAPASGPVAHPVGIFDEQFVLAKGSAEAGVEAGVPAVFFLLADLPVDPENDKPTLTIRGVAYRVIERDKDGMGGIVLFVRRIT